MSKTKDEIVKELFAVVQAEKAEIAKAEKPHWKTNCSFCNEYGMNRINIQTITDIDVLVLALGDLYEKYEYFNKAAKVLDVDIPFLWLGFTLEDWESDFKTRINKIQITKKKAKLEKLTERLDKLVSIEEREKMELEALQKEINNL